MLCLTSFFSFGPRSVIHYIFSHEVQSRQRRSRNMRGDTFLDNSEGMADGKSNVVIPSGFLHSIKLNGDASVSR